VLVSVADVELRGARHQQQGEDEQEEQSRRGVHRRRICDGFVLSSALLPVFHSCGIDADILRHFFSIEKYFMPPAIQ